MLGVRQKIGLTTLVDKGEKVFITPWTGMIAPKSHWQNCYQMSLPRLFLRLAQSLVSFTWEELNHVPRLQHTIKNMIKSSITGRKYLSNYIVQSIYPIIQIKLLTTLFLENIETKVCSKSITTERISMIRMKCYVQNVFQIKKSA